MNFKTLFTQYVAVLTKYKHELKPLQINLQELAKISDSIKQDKTSFSYSFSNFKVVIPKSIKPSHSIPQKLDDITVFIQVKNTISVRLPVEKLIQDPMLSLESFNIVLKSGNYDSSWHLDRHVMAENESEGKHLHPLYHMTFGGLYMEERNKEDDGVVYGNSLIVRSPRLMHPPLELILGIDFILRHFIPKKQLTLLSHKPYNDLVNKMKKAIWLPFALSMAKNYCDNILVDNVAYNFDSNFVERVIGHN